MHQPVENLARWLFENSHAISWDALILSDTNEVKELVAKWRQMAASCAQVLMRAPVLRHKKGGTYTFIGYGRSTVDLSPQAVYVDEAGELWVRPKDEFIDGRFVPHASGT